MIVCLSCMRVNPDDVDECIECGETSFALLVVEEEYADQDQ